MKASFGVSIRGTGAAALLAAGAVGVLGPGQARAQVPLTCGGEPATIIGTEGDDGLTGTPGSDVIVGLGGNDVLSGVDGFDILCGGEGNDTFLARDNKKDKVNGGDGFDTATLDKKDKRDGIESLLA